MRTAQGISSFYNDMGHSAHLTQASPHELISLLYKQARKKIALAREAGAHGDISQRAQSIHRACSIIDALRISLDPEVGGEIAMNLEDLYDYLYRRLLQATAMEDESALGEADGLLATLQRAWDEIGDQAHETLMAG